MTVACKSVLCLMALLTIASAVAAQPRNPASANIKGSVMVSVSNLVDDPTGCVIRNYTGMIIKVHHDEEYGVRIDGFTLLGPKGERDYFNVEQGIYDEFRLPRSDIGWLPTLIKANNRVKVLAYLCGVSGGVALAHNISLLTPTTKRPKRLG